MATEITEPKKKFNPRARHMARRAIMQAMYQWQLAATSPTDLEIQFVTEESVSKFDVAFFKQFIYAIPNRCEQLDLLLTPHLKRAIHELDPVELAILRIATLELVDWLETPYRVIINEWLELAKQFGAEDSYKFVNAALDSLVKTLRPIEVSQPKR